MSQSSSTWTTFSSTLAICPNTRPMFRRYSEDSELTDSLSEPISASFTSPPVNTLDICYHPKALPWHHTKSRISRIGPNLEKLKTFNHSSVLPTSTDIPFMDTLKSLYPSRTLPERVQFGTLLMSADRLSKHLKRHLPQHRSSPIGFQTLRSRLKPMPPTMHSLQYCQSQPRMVNCTPLHSIPDPFQLWNSTTMCTTKSYLRFLKPSNDGCIILKALHSQSTWSPITGTCNIFPRPRSSRGAKHAGPNTSQLSTSSYGLGPGSSVPNLMHLLDDGMSILKREVATIPVLTHRTFVQCSHLNNWHCPSELPP